MANSYLSTKNGVNSIDDFLRKRDLRTDGRTDDGRPRHGISSADTVKQSQKWIVSSQGQREGFHPKEVYHKGRAYNVTVRNPGQQSRGREGGGGG